MTERAASVRGTGDAGQQEEPDPEPAGQAERARALSLIDYLADYDALRNPPVPDITESSMFLLEGADLPKVAAVRLRTYQTAWLSVDFLEMPPAPMVPAHLMSVIGDSSNIRWDSRPAVLRPWFRPESEAESGRALDRAGAEWITGVWEPFAAKSEQVAAARRLHRDLFQQRELLTTDRASIEVVWGFGRLRWNAGGLVIDHPLVTLPVEISYDADTQRLRVTPSGAPQVEARFLAGITLADRAGYMSICEMVEESGLDLWDPRELGTVLQLLISAVDAKGTLATCAPRGPDRAVADASWALWTRRRQPDYQGFLTQLRELYCGESVAVPGALQAILTDTPSALPEADSAGEPLLLPLPANEEQQRILDRARRSAGVTVQGPPGTGKSHTIANIISHYAACGKRVLVVAEKEQALRSLIDKIPPQISALAVAVVGEDAASRRELESAIEVIQARVAEFDPAFAAERIRRLTAEIEAVSQETDAATDALLAARQADVEQLDGTWPAGDAPTRAQAARWVAAHAGTLGYIDDAIPPSIPPPLDAGELASLVALIREIGADQAAADAGALPDLASVPPAADLQAWFTRLADGQDPQAGVVAQWDKAAAAGADGLHALSARCQAAADWLAATAGSWPDTVRAHAGDPEQAGVWESVSAQLAADRQEALAQRAVLAARTVSVPDVIEPWLADGLRQARGRLEAPGRLRRLGGPAKRAAQACRVDGWPPSSAGDFDVCLAAVSLATLRQRMMTAWRSQLGQVLDDDCPEDALGPLLPDLRRAVDWPHTWAQLRGDLAAAGLDVPDTADAGVLSDLADAATRCSGQLARLEASRSVAELEHRLHSGAAAAGAPPLWGMLADALARRDAPRWAQLRAELAGLAQDAPAARRLSELRARLAGVAPAWTARILADPAAAGNPADLPRAWQWRQLDTWIAAGLAGTAPAALQARLEELSGRRRRLVTELVAERAWARIAAGLGDSQRRALNAYVQAVTKFGKSGGKFSQRWLGEIRAAVNGARDAIPVWIMPVSRSLTSFRPAAQAPFDVLIVDEASQIGIEGLPLLALADQAIVVGDDKQVSPEHPGLDRQRVFRSLDQHLPAIPAYKTLFDPDTSLYDLASARFPGVVMLSEHFRCLPPIIAFSSARYYDNRIIPLRDRAPRPGWAALRTLKVPDGDRSGDENEPEADAIVDLIARMCADPDYAGMDIGVISLLALRQSKVIRDKLYDRLGPKVLLERRLRVGEPASFQGDERDVIICSTVVTPKRKTGTRIAPMSGRGAARRINVAASRARQQLWVVHSADPADFSGLDVRAALIRHCQEPAVTAPPAGDQLAACQSQFECDVLQAIRARGYAKVQVAHQVGRFTIDMVVEGPDTSLAVACDGDRWDGPEVWRRDRDRQQVLERAGWRFERIRAAAFYRDPGQALQPLWDRLEGLGIPPGVWWDEPQPDAQDGEEPAAAPPDEHHDPKEQGPPDFRPATWLEVFPWLGDTGEATSGPWTQVIDDTDEPTRRRCVAAVTQFAADRLVRRTFREIFPGLAPELPLKQLGLPARAVTALDRHDIVVVADLARVTPRQLRGWNGISAHTTAAALLTLTDLSASMAKPVPVATAAPAGLPDSEPVDVPVPVPQKSAVTQPEEPATHATAGLPATMPAPVIATAPPQAPQAPAQTTGPPDSEPDDVPEEPAASAPEGLPATMPGPAPAAAAPQAPAEPAGLADSGPDSVPEETAATRSPDDPADVSPPDLRRATWLEVFPWLADVGEGAADPCWAQVIGDTDEVTRDRCLAAVAQLAAGQLRSVFGQISPDRQPELAWQVPAVTAAPPDAAGAPDPAEPAAAEPPEPAAAEPPEPDPAVEAAPEVRRATWLEAFPWLTWAGEAASDPRWAQVIDDSGEPARDEGLTTVAQLAAIRLTRRTFAQIFPRLEPGLELAQLELGPARTNLLARHGVKRMADLAEVTLGKFTDWHGVGVTSIDKILLGLAEASASMPAPAVTAAPPQAPAQTTDLPDADSAAGEPVTLAPEEHQDPAELSPADLRPATWLEAFPWLPEAEASAWLAEDQIVPWLPQDESFPELPEDETFEWLPEDDAAASRPCWTQAIADTGEETRARYLNYVAQLAACLEPWTFGQLFPVLPPELDLLHLAVPTRVLTVLKQNKAPFMADLANVTLDEFMTWRNVGVTTVGALLRHLADLSVSPPPVAVDGAGPAAAGRIVRIVEAPVPPVLAGLADDLTQVATWYAAAGLPGGSPLGALPSWTPAPIVAARQRMTAVSADGVLSPAQLDVDVAAVLAEAAEDFEPRTLQILSARVVSHPPTLDQLGAEHGVTRERIRQIEANAHGKLSGVVPLALMAESARNFVGTLCPLDDLLAAMPALARTVPALEQPAWQVLRWLDGSYEITDGWCAAPKLAAVADATKKQLAERADDCGVVRLAELDVLQSADPARQRELTASWLQRCGYRLEGDCILLRTHSVHDRAAAVLAMAGKPLSIQEIADRSVAGVSVRSLQNKIRADERLVRVDVHRWALKRWGLPAYPGIRPLIAEQIAEHGGQVPFAELVENLTSRFSVSANSVRSYATDPPFQIRAGMISHTERHRAARKTPQETRRLFRHDGAWRYRVRVTAEHLKGSGSPAPTAIAGILGLQTGQTRQLDSRLGPQTVSWAGSQPTLGTIRRFLTDRDGEPDIAAGTEVFLDFDDDGTFGCEPTRELTGDPLTDALILAGAPETAGPAALATAIGLAPDAPMASLIPAYRKRGDTDIAELLTGTGRELAG